MIMSFVTISRQILGCLLLVLLSRHADADKSNYLESISASLQRLEDIIVKQSEQNVLSCIIPAEKLISLLSEHLTASNESNEIQSNGPNSNIRRSLEHDIQQLLRPKKLKHRRKNKNQNENANINENINTNINADRYHRRSFGGGDPHLSKAHNQNMNSNINFNSNLNRNRDDIFDFSDEE